MNGAANAAPAWLEAVRREYGLIRGYVYTALAALVVGVLLGPLQALDKVDFNPYPFLKPLIYTYYQGLTLHGVMLALVWTTFFITGFMAFVVMHDFERPLFSRRLNQVTLGVMWLGLALVTYTVLTNKATVLFTSYAPLMAHPLYYVGLALMLAVGSWLLTVNVYLTYREWRREHPGERLPLRAFGVLVTLAMWNIGLIGVTVEFLVYLIPWSLGLLPGVDPVLTRSLFWFTGHPIVYYWLLPAYISWYFMLPKQVDGRLFSETMARLALLLFIPFSVPVGFHHMFTDPGVNEHAKMLHAFFTFIVFLPSLLTAFTVLASLEVGGRARGGRGWLGWIRSLPWENPSVAAQLLAMILFAGGGVMGLINASYQLNLMVHNSLFVVSHFHLTVGTATTLTFMGIAYWFIPEITGRRLWSEKMARLQVWAWFLGMAVFGRGLSLLGLAGVPRRTWLAQATYELASPPRAGIMTAVGGMLLFVSMILFMWNVVATARRAPALLPSSAGTPAVRTPAGSGTSVTEAAATASTPGLRPSLMPVAEPLVAAAAGSESNAGSHGGSGDSRAVGAMTVPVWLDRLTPWVIGSLLLTALAWGPMLLSMLATPYSAQGWQPW